MHSYIGSGQLLNCFSYIHCIAAQSVKFGDYQHVTTFHAINYNRTSDHYLIYTEHMWDSVRFVLIGLMTSAHERMPVRDTRLLSYFSEVAEDFHAS